MANIDELLSKIKNLEDDVSELQRKQLSPSGVVSDRKDVSQLKFPLDIETQKILNNILKDTILDTSWNDYFRYFEVFNSFDSLSESIVGTSGIRFTATAQPVVELFTGATSGNSVLEGKHLFQQEFLSFDKQQYFRTQFQVDSVTSLTANLTIGPDGYGFRIVNNSLRGFVTDNAAVETVVTLQTIALDTTYLIEAKFFPGKKVVFKVDDVEKGIITSGLPTGEHTNLWSLELTTNAAGAKSMLVQTFDFIQRLF